MWCYTLFPKILNMSLTAGIVIVLVMLARLPLKKAPKIFSYALWAVVLFRLLCPISFSSDFSLLGAFHDPTVTNGSIAYIPADIVHTTNPQVDLPLPCASKVINESLPQGAEQTGADPLEAPMAIATLLWLGGIVAMLVYSVISLLLLRRTLVGAVRLRANIYLADHIATPFVMGVIRPKIYLPSALSGQEQEYIILHEQTHIQRLDHIVKLVAFLALALHWFNPLVWAAFILSGKDMEMSCDESVMGHMDRDIRREYSTSLLSLATGRKIISGIPLAFLYSPLKDLEESLVVC
jgi:beta-lactamase regulating signal transducer with metallopeptidase domain